MIDKNGNYSEYSDNYIGISFETIFEIKKKRILKGFPHSIDGQYYKSFSLLNTDVEKWIKAVLLEVEEYQLIKLEELNKMNIILDNSVMATLLHETLGHTLEIDRIAGFERGFIGSSFIKMNNVSKFIGSEQLTVTINKYDEQSLEKINAIEAISARIYFKEIFGEDFTRKNNSVINEHLNYGYSLIRAIISVVIVSKGLHPSLGICHKSSLNSFNLSDDIIEIYRPMVDYAVKLYNDHNQSEKFDYHCREFLLRIIHQKVIYQDEVMTVKRSIEMFIDNLIKYFNEGETLSLPKLDVNLYDFK